MISCGKTKRYAPMLQLTVTCSRIPEISRRNCVSRCSSWSGDTADRAAETKGVLQMLGELLEDLIADRMAVFVVDVLEIIQITDQKPAG